MFLPMTESTYLLAERLGQLLRGLKHTVTTAESCTGGGIGQAITLVPGSSAWFEAGYITYSNRMKSKLLGVPPALIEAHGAVSEPVVLAMAAGAIQHSAANYAVAVSGVAGPDGGTPNKPVGTVCFAWGAADALQAATVHFEGDRHDVREQSVNFALLKLIRLCEQN
ncbi:CinA family protein [Saccharophagus degradans]|nr:CinA family protein [Saccharophagus degradans]